MDILQKALDLHARRYDSNGMKDNANTNFKAKVCKNIIIIVCFFLFSKAILSLNLKFSNLRSISIACPITLAPSQFRTSRVPSSTSPTWSGSLPVSTTFSIKNRKATSVSSSFSWDCIFYLQRFPQLNKENMYLVRFWLKQYNETFQVEKKTAVPEKQEETVKKKKILPKSSMKRINDIFNLLDDEKKGCMGFIDRFDCWKPAETLQFRIFF